MQVGSMGQEDPLEEEMETFSSILAWTTPWTVWQVRVRVVRESDMSEHPVLETLLFYIPTQNLKKQ